MTILPPSFADRLDIWETQLPAPLKDSRPVHGLFHLYLYHKFLGAEHYVPSCWQRCPFANSTMHIQSGPKVNYLVRCKQLLVN